MAVSIGFDKFAASLEAFHPFVAAMFLRFGANHYMTH
jgi:hypothetical protein